ncbi:hypothetical protein K6V98_00105 [Collinsella sp. AGMB00827]|uniref:Cpl-7 lysozyme C-terminal domain-containing protein n=1 Tax=Collinsella ureilytica TaxID=2869515 RepID=A0ABS7MHI6_9ACTN|nr:hypothetical protein [Collinsella urealyticum]MBY4796772.1 hypothetical protein [Collinsella urealyticum]
MLDEIVQRVLNGEFGNCDDRRKRLERAGYSYKQVQDEINRRAAWCGPRLTVHDLENLAHMVLNGELGGDHEQRFILGEDYAAVSRRVAELKRSYQL